jgi:hypothetical protein
MGARQSCCAGVSLVRGAAHFRDVQVEVAIGHAAAVETITMAEAGKNRLVYQRP